MASLLTFEKLIESTDQKIIAEGIYTINVYDKKDSTGGTLMKKVNVRAKTIKEVKAKLRKKYPLSKYFYQIDYFPEDGEYQPGIL
jgi:hypothetical protein